MHDKKAAEFPEPKVVALTGLGDETRSTFLPLFVAFRLHPPETSGKKLDFSLRGLTICVEPLEELNDALPWAV